MQLSFQNFNFTVVIRSPQHENRPDACFWLMVFALSLRFLRHLLFYRFGVQRNKSCLFDPGFYSLPIWNVFLYMYILSSTLFEAWSLHFQCTFPAKPHTLPQCLPIAINALDGSNRKNIVKHSIPPSNCYPKYHSLNDPMATYLLLFHIVFFRMYSNCINFMTNTIQGTKYKMIKNFFWQTLPYDHPIIHSWRAPNILFFNSS